MAAVTSLVNISVVDFSVVDFSAADISVADTSESDVSMADISSVDTSIMNFSEVDTSAVVISLASKVCEILSVFLQVFCPHDDLSKRCKDRFFSDFQGVICAYPMIHNFYFLMKFLLNFDRVLWTNNGRRRPQTNF